MVPRNTSLVHMYTSLLHMFVSLFHTHWSLLYVYKSLVHTHRSLWYIWTCFLYIRLRLFHKYVHISFAHPMDQWDAWIWILKRRITSKCNALCEIRCNTPNTSMRSMDVDPTETDNTKIAERCNMLQHDATRCNTLQHTQYIDEIHGCGS